LFFHLKMNRLASFSRGKSLSNSPFPQFAPSKLHGTQLLSLSSNSKPKRTISTRPTKGDVKIPAKIDTKNQTVTINKSPHTLEGAKKELIDSFKNEMVRIQDAEKASDDVEIASKWLKDSKFKLEEKDGLISLSKQDKNMLITISFDAVDKEGPEEPFDDLEGGEEGEELLPGNSKSSGKNMKEEDEEEEAEEENEEEEGDDDSVGGNKPKRKDYTLEVAFLDKQGKTKGRWSIQGFSGEDDRLFVDSLSLPPKEPKSVKETTSQGIQLEDFGDDETYSVFSFDEMSQEVQDKIYDFLDLLGADDQLAFFIRQYPVRFRNRAQTQFLEDLSKLLADK